MKIKMGRPKLEKGLARGVVIAARFSSSEAKEIKTAIDGSGKKQPQWVRDSLLASARQKSG